ncbi:aspartyl protease family protein [Candidatus Gribaldobacteria bacterium]|nr:aspartyl protease family protein [Candidatus Gribaldobacteria bacterium]
MPSLTTRLADLQRLGPIIEVMVIPSRALREAILKDKKQIPGEPQSVRLTMLIDTGASVSAIKKGVAQKLNLEPHGITRIATPSHKEFECPLYDVDLLFPNHKIAVANITAIESEFEGQAIDGLIGRDVLKNGLMIYSGYDNSFTLAF